MEQFNKQKQMIMAEVDQLPATKSQGYDWVIDSINKLKPIAKKLVWNSDTANVHIANINNVIEYIICEQIRGEYKSRDYLLQIRVTESQEIIKTFAMYFTLYEAKQEAQEDMQKMFEEIIE